MAINAQTSQVIPAMLESVNPELPALLAGFERSLAPVEPVDDERGVLEIGPGAGHNQAV